MRILIDGRSIKENPSGVGIWNLELVKYLLQLTQDITIYLILPHKCSFPFSTSSEFMPFLKTQRFHIIESPYKYQFIGGKRLLFDQWFLPRIIQKIQPDIYHETDSYGIPFLASSQTKYLLTVHDVIPITSFSETKNILLRNIYRYSVALSLKKAGRVVAISDITKRDLTTYYHIPPTDIQVVCDGKPTITTYSQAEVQEKWNSLQIKYDLTINKYILYYGGFGLRRNISSVLNVFKQLLISQVISEDHKLVLSGRLSNAKKEYVQNYEELKKIVKKLNLEKNVVFLDYMDQLTKQTLIQHCLTSVFISFYEGFGLVPFETLLQGKYGVFSKVGIWYSYPEKSMFLVEEPSSEVELYTKLKNCITSDSSQIETEYQKVMNFVNQFSWKKMATEYITLYRTMLHI